MDRGNAASTDAELTTTEISAVTELVAAASRESLRWFRPRTTGAVPSDGQLSVENKWAQSGGFDPVTEADRAVERLIRDALAELFPADTITGEEFGTEGEGRREWFIDPIDGTRAFISGQPMWGTLVGLVAEGSPVAGWMHIPTLGETYVGLPGRTDLVVPAASMVAGTGETSITLKSRSTSKLDDAVALSTDPSMFAAGPEFDRFAELVRKVKLHRYGGDCMNYALVASGDADLVVENQLAPYDIIPLIPIIEGAGGLITDLEGNLPLNGGYVVAAANASLHAATLEFLNR